MGHETRPDEAGRTGHRDPHARLASQPLPDWCPARRCGTRRRPMREFLFVCLAGAAGTGARFALSTGIGALLGTQFPYGTIVVNVLGSFAIAVIAYASTVGELVPPAVRLVLTTGFLGGFTTYSAFNQETVACLEQGLWVRATVNVSITLLACLAAGLLGVGAARRLLGP
jgi:CrcB protein